MVSDLTNKGASAIGSCGGLESPESSLRRDMMSAVDSMLEPPGCGGVNIGFGGDCELSAPSLENYKMERRP